MELDLVLSVQEKSNYFKGLLILMIKDRKIDDGERKILENVGKLLGFESEFCKTAINESLENEYLLDDVPAFSNKDIAQSFVMDGLKLAVSDRELNPEELSYLIATIKKNEIDIEWFSKQLENLVINIDGDYYDSTLHIEKYL